MTVKKNDRAAISKFTNLRKLDINNYDFETMPSLSVFTNLTDLKIYWRYKDYRDIFSQNDYGVLRNLQNLKIRSDFYKMIEPFESTLRFGNQFDV